MRRPHRTTPGPGTVRRANSGCKKHCPNIPGSAPADGDVREDWPGLKRPFTWSHRAHLVSLQWRAPLTNDPSKLADLTWNDTRVAPTAPMDHSILNRPFRAGLWIAPGMEADWSPTIRSTCCARCASTGDQQPPYPHFPCAHSGSTGAIWVAFPIPSCDRSARGLQFVRTKRRSFTSYPGGLHADLRQPCEVHAARSPNHEG